MHPTMESIYNMFKFNTQVFEQVLEGLTEDHEHARPIKRANSVNWVAGHIVRYRYSIANLLGVDAESPWGELYRKGTEATNGDKYPSLDEIRAAWKDISAKMLKAIKEAEEETLTKVPPWTKPGLENSIRGTVTFLAFHESYHLGQLGFLRKFHDLDAAFG